MGAVKNLYHDAIEAKNFIENEMPESARLYEAVAKAIAPHLCASDRAKDEHWVIAVDVLNVFRDEMDRWTDTSNLDARLVRVEQAIFPGEFSA